MRTPSIKMIQPLTRTSGDAKLAKRALTMGTYEIISEQWGDTFPHTMKWVRSCYNRPKPGEIRRAMVDEVLGTYGVEWLRSDDQPGGLRLRGDRELAYCNMGYAYAPTICWEFQRVVFGGLRLMRVFVGSWGDWVERWESRRRREGED